MACSRSLCEIRRYTSTMIHSMTSLLISCPDLLCIITFFIPTADVTLNDYLRDVCSCPLLLLHQPMECLFPAPTHSAVSLHSSCGTEQVRRRLCLIHRSEPTERDIGRCHLHRATEERIEADFSTVLGGRHRGRGREGWRDG